jgi:hypothetical protein
MGLFDWLKFKKSSAGTVNKWKLGDRVLAKWQDSYFYPGVVRDIQGDGCLVVYDDGNSLWVHHAHVVVEDIAIGSRVFCRIKNSPNFLPGVIHQKKGETILVRYDHGEEEWTSVSMLRVQRPIVPINPSQMTGPIGQPAKQTIDLGEPVKDSNWRTGDRVLARWVDFFWYPGTILNMGERGIHVLFDDGDQRVVQENQIAVLAVEEGEHIFIRPKNEPQRLYSPATVSGAHGERIDVEFEDGTMENNTRVSRARFWRCPVGVPNFPFEEGDRVLALDSDDCVYPAEIISIEDEERIIVQYLDGPERMLTPELIKRFEVKVGMKIECRWSGGPNYFPGNLSKIEGERIHVKYDDGDDEWSVVRLMRIPPKRPNP